MLHTLVVELSKYCNILEENPPQVIRLKIKKKVKKNFKNIIIKKSHHKTSKQRHYEIQNVLFYFSNRYFEGY